MSSTSARKRLRARKPPRDGSHVRIFISYGHDDNSEFVLRFQRDLESGGHETWIDDQRIEHGDDWRRSITDGLQRTDAVLAFLSRHAVRDPGVCRDELAIALSIPEVSVQTILLERLALEELPTSVRHIEWLDLSDWRARRDQGGEAFEAWYPVRLQDVIAKLAPQPQYRAEIERLERQLRPAPDGVRAAELLQTGFNGRQWLRDEVERWRVARRSRVLCITGEPGIGKSAIAAWLARSNPVQTVALHFCQYDLPDSRESRRVVASIAFQIARRLPDFRHFLLRAVDRLDTGDGGKAVMALQPAEAFIKLLAEPAQACIDGGRERHLVIIDGLDEAGPELPQFLAAHHTKLPMWLGFIVTSRPDEPLIRTHLQALQLIELDAAEARNLDDAREYARQWLQSQARLDTARTNVLADAFAEASGGNFLYLSLVRQLAEEQRVSWDAVADLQRLPRGLDGFFLGWFQRQFPDLETYETVQAPLLRLLVASELPVPLLVAERALPHADQETLRRKMLRPLGSLFRVRHAAVGVFHPTLRDWLRDDSRAGDYYVSAKLGHAPLARALWQELCELRHGMNLSAYAIEELPTQLLQAGAELQTQLLPDAASWDVRRATLVGLAEAAELGGRSASALAWRRLIYTLDERLYAGPRVEVAANFNALGLLLGEAGDWNAAGRLFERATRVYHDLHGMYDEDVAISTNYLGHALSALGRTEEARSMYLYAAQFTRALPKDRQRYMAAYLHNFATTLVESDPKKAQETLELALDLALLVHGEEHLVVVLCLSRLAELKQERGDAAGSHALLARALRIAQGPELAPIIEVSQVAGLLQALAQADLAQGRPAAALASLQRALALRREELGVNHLEVAGLEFQLAQALQQCDQFTAAVPLLTHALAICRMVHGDQHSATSSVRRSLAFVLRHEGQFAEARSVYAELLRIDRERLEAGHPADGLVDDDALVEFVLTLQLCAAEDAAASLRDAWRAWEPRLHHDGQFTAAAQFTILYLMILGGSAAAARALLRTHLQLLQQNPGPLHASTRICQLLLEAIISRHP